MNLPPDFEFVEDHHLLIYRPHGVLDQSSVDRVVSIVSELELTLKEPFSRFWDASGCHDADLSFKYATDVSLSRRLASSGHPSIKSAVLATNPKVIHYARLLEVLTQGSPIKVHLFETREEVAKWLRVPLEILMPKDAPLSAVDKADNA